MKVVLFLLLSILGVFSFTPATEYRSIDGTGNNIPNPTFGAAFSPYVRFGGFFYSDGISEPRGGGIATNFTLPNERNISRIFFNCSTCTDPPPITSDFAWACGLYLAIETTRTLTQNPAEEFDVSVEPTDPVFGPLNVTALPFKRQKHIVNNVGPRITINGVSSFIDGHPIYGENSNQTDYIRAHAGGLIATEFGKDGLEYPILVGTAPFPPGVAIANLANNVPTSELFRFGDARMNQNPVLMTIGILWIREHNRQARKLQLQNPTAGDEILFQEARRRTIALIQHFYETEYIPSLLGPKAPGPYTGYDVTVDASLDHMMATAALRYGHTQVSSETIRVTNKGQQLSSMILRDNFFDPSLIKQDGIDPILRGLNEKEHNTGEVTLISDLRNNLYAHKGSPNLDLVAINIRRAREVGLPSYGEARIAYGLPPKPTFVDVNAGNAPLLELIYGTTNSSNCDPWLCGIQEDSVNGGELGDLFSTIIGNQFNRLRTGDRFWYDQASQFAGADLAEIKATRMVDIIFRNTKIPELTCDPFTVKGQGKLCKSGSSFVLPSLLLVCFAMFFFLF